VILKENFRGAVEQDAVTAQGMEQRRSLEPTHANGRREASLTAVHHQKPRIVESRGAAKDYAFCTG
jgi:hypothetical protein